MPPESTSGHQPFSRGDRTETPPAAGSSADVGVNVGGTLPQGFLGDPQPDRLCTRRTGRQQDGAEVVCGRPAAVHIDWGDACGYACMQHAQEILDKHWPVNDCHELGAFCGMPGTLWSYVEQRCIPDPDGIATIEPVRAVAQEIPA